MKNKNHYQEAPEHYLLCYNTTCGKAKTCLHQLVACAGINKDAIVECVNPAVNEGENCTYYQQDHIVQMAYGIREFGIRKGLKKLVISSKIRIFIGENQ